VDLFKRKKQHDLAPGSIWAVEPEPVVDYNSVMEYLTGLSPEDYTKVMQVSAVYRQSEYEACKILNVEFAPSTFIVQPEEPELEIPFLEDEPKRKKVTKNGKA
jgi:hypothetical protein